LPWCGWRCRSPASVGRLLAASLLAALAPRQAIALCALGMFALGTGGLWRFGLAEPQGEQEAAAFAAEAAR